MIRYCSPRYLACCSRGRRERRGAAAVEFALCLPFLITLIMGAMESCNLIYVRTRMNSVAYEGARTATRPTTASNAGAVTADVTNRCNSLLSQLGVTGGTVSLQVLDSGTSQPKDLSLAVPQDLVTVSVVAPLSQNCITMLVMSGSMSVTAKATLVME